MKLAFFCAIIGYIGFLSAQHQYMKLSCNVDPKPYVLEMNKNSVCAVDASENLNCPEGGCCIISTTAILAGFSAIVAPFAMGVSGAAVLCAQVGGCWLMVCGMHGAAFSSANWHMRLNKKEKGNRH